MKSLFEPALVGGVSLRNRLIRSATFEYAGDAQGRYTPGFKRLYAELALGGVGGIITGMVGVDETALYSPNMIQAYGDNFVSGLSELVELTHKLGSKVIVQLAHCGLRARPLEEGGKLLGPCDLDQPPSAPGRAMRPEEIAALAKNFAAAALRCRQAGADAVQLHCAHGYLLSQFLSPYFNQRTDEYGGNMTGRSRIVMEVYEAVRQAVGDDFPVWVKINCQDLIEPGSSTEEYFQVCEALAGRGLNAIELSVGLGLGKATTSARPVPSQNEEAPFAAQAQALAGRVSCDVISVCGHRRPQRMEEVLQQGRLAAISLCRPLISEPDLPTRWQAGDARPARCISCNQCFRSKGCLACAVNFNSN